MAQRVFDNQDPFFRRGNQIVEQETKRLSQETTPTEVIINRPDQPLNDMGTNTPNGNNNTGNSGQNVPVNVAPAAEPVVDYGR